MSIVWCAAFALSLNVVGYESAMSVRVVNPYLGRQSLAEIYGLPKEFYPHRVHLLGGGGEFQPCPGKLSLVKVTGSH